MCSNERYAFSQCWVVKKCLERINSYKSRACVVKNLIVSCFFSVLYSFRFSFLFLSVDQLGGNVLFFRIGTTIRVIRILLNSHLSLDSRYILYGGSTLSVCLAKIKFPKTNSDILVQRSSVYVNSALVHRSFTDQASDTSRFLIFYSFFFFLLFHTKGYVVTVPLKQTSVPLP